VTAYDTLGHTTSASVSVNVNNSASSAAVVISGVKQSYTPTVSLTQTNNKLGDAIILAVQSSTSKLLPAAVVDTSKNVYAAIGPAHLASGVEIQVFCAPNIRAATTNTITATITGSTNSLLLAAEATGVGCPTIPQVVSSGYGGNPSLSITTTARSMVYSVLFLANGQAKTGSGFTQISAYPSPSVVYDVDEYELQTAAGSTPIKFTNGNTSNGAWNLIAAAFPVTAPVAYAAPQPANNLLDTWLSTYTITAKARDVSRCGCINQSFSSIRTRIQGSNTPQALQALSELENRILDPLLKGETVRWTRSNLFKTGIRSITTIVAASILPFSSETCRFGMGNWSLTIEPLLFNSKERSHAANFVYAIRPA
jgi:hypothetical protein